MLWVNIHWLIHYYVQGGGGGKNDYFHPWLEPFYRCVKMTFSIDILV